MKLVKLFKFSELPDFVSDYLFDFTLNFISDYSLDYGAFKYTIGVYEREFDNASEKDKKGYPIEEINLCRKITAWFVEQGCSVGETIYLNR